MPAASEPIRVWHGPGLAPRIWTDEHRAESPGEARQEETRKWLVAWFIGSGKLHRHYIVLRLNDMQGDVLISNGARTRLGVRILELFR